MYYIAIILFIVGGQWLYSGLRGNDFVSTQAGIVVLIACSGTVFVTSIALSVLEIW